MVSNTTSERSRGRTRRQFLGATAATTAAVSGFVGAGAAQPDAAGKRPSGHASTEDVDVGCGVPEDAEDPVLAALERNAVPLEFGDGTLHLCDLAVTATRLLDWPALGRLFRARSWQRSSDELPETVIAGALSEYPIVGMGEATHGTKEFQAVRRRLVQRLVEDHGLRVVAFEDQFSELTAVNDYVVHGEGTVEDATNALLFWIFRTEEVRELLEWLREFNEGRPREDRVEVHGVDCQDAAEPARAALDFLERADLEGTDAVEDGLQPIAESQFDGYFLEGTEPLTLREDRVETGRDLVADLEALFEEQRESLVAATSERAWQFARRHAEALSQAIDVAEARVTGDEPAPWFEPRDRYMAANATWLFEALDADQLVFWAHNGHVKRGTIHGGKRTLGDHLAETYGDDYYPLAFEFGAGSFTAMRPESDGFEGTIDAPAAAPAERLAAAAYPSLFLDFETASADPRLRDWLADLQELHDVGGTYLEDHRTGEYDLDDAFDGLIFVEESTPTSVLPLTAPAAEATAQGSRQAEQEIVDRAELP